MKYNVTHSYLYCNYSFHYLAIRLWMFTYKLYLLELELFHHRFTHKSITYRLFINILEIENALYA